MLAYILPHHYASARPIYMQETGRINVALTGLSHCEGTTEVQIGVCREDPMWSISRDKYAQISTAAQAQLVLPRVFWSMPGNLETFCIIWRQPRNLILPLLPFPAYNMLCEICVWMLRGRRGRNFGGTLGLQFVHHDSAESFWTSVALDCSICRVLGNEVGANFFATFRRKALAHEEAFLDLRSLAHLSVVSSTSDRSVSIYRLDFLVEWAGTRIRHTFVLRPTGFQGYF